jgi:hypothetical protein
MVINWCGVDPYKAQIKYLADPTSIHDGDAARLQLIENNTALNDLLTIHASSLTKIQSLMETATANAHTETGKRCKAAAENEEVVVKDIHRNILTQYPQWWP